MDFTSDAAKYLLTQGVLGLAVLVLGVVVFFLWRELQKTQALNDAKDEKLVETLTLWREDTKATNEKIAAFLDKSVVIASALQEGMNLLSRGRR